MIKKTHPNSLSKTLIQQNQLIVNEIISNADFFLGEKREEKKYMKTIPFRFINMSLKDAFRDFHRENIGSQVRLREVGEKKK